MHRQKGYSLIELIIFIIVIGIITSGLSVALLSALRGEADRGTGPTASLLAQTRMDVILGQRWRHGFSGMIDICVASPRLPVCDVPDGYTVSSTITPVGSDYKTIEVTVSGSGESSLTSQVADF